MTDVTVWTSWSSKYLSQSLLLHRCLPSVVMDNHIYTSGLRIRRFRISEPPYNGLWRKKRSDCCLFQIPTYEIFSSEHNNLQYVLSCAMKWYIIYMKSLKISKGQSESVYRRGTYNTMTKRKSSKRQTRINFKEPTHIFKSIYFLFFSFTYCLYLCFYKQSLCLFISMHTSYPSGAPEFTPGF
jgi:hypothetical protein